MLMLFIPAWFIVLIGINETAFLTIPVENAVYPAIAPWTAFYASLAHIIVSYAFAATDRIAYVGSMYFKFTFNLWFSFSFYTLTDLKHTIIKLPTLVEILNSLKVFTIFFFLLQEYLLTLGKAKKR